MRNIVIVAVIFIVIIFSSRAIYAASFAEEKYSEFIEKYSSIKDSDIYLNNIWRCGRKILGKEEFSKLLRDQRKWIADRNKVILDVKVNNAGAKRLEQFISDRIVMVNRYIYECKVVDENNEFKKIDKNITAYSAVLDLRRKDGWQQEIWYHLERNNIISSEQQRGEHDNNVGYWYVEGNKVNLVIRKSYDVLSLRIDDNNKFIFDEEDGSYFSVSYCDEIDNKNVSLSNLESLENNANDGKSAYLVSRKYKEAKNDIKSAIWCVKAAEYGYKKAYEEAAELLISGENVPNDFKKGLYYYKKAEESGTLSAAGKVEYAICLRRNENGVAGTQKVLALANQTDFLDKLPVWTRDRLLIVAAYIELDLHNTDSAIEFWDKILNKDEYRDIHTDVEYEFNYLDTMIPKLKAENAPKSNEDVLNAFKEFYFSKFPQQEGYKSIREAFSAFFTDPVWNVYRMEKYKNTYVIVFKGISSHRGIKKLYECPFVLKYKNGVPKIEASAHYGLFCKANGKFLSDDDYLDMLYTIMLETKMW